MASLAEHHDEAVDRSLIDDLHTLVDDGKARASAEIAFYKAQAGFVGQAAGRIAVFGVVAIVLALLALIGFTVGMIIVLTPLITALGATALVCVVMLGGAAFCGMKALGHWTELSASFSAGGKRNG